MSSLVWLLPLLVLTVALSPPPQAINQILTLQNKFNEYLTTQDVIPVVEINKMFSQNKLTSNYEGYSVYTIVDSTTFSQSTNETIQCVYKFDSGTNWNKFEVENPYVLHFIANLPTAYIGNPKNEYKIEPQSNSNLTNVSTEWTLYNGFESKNYKISFTFNMPEWSLYSITLHDSKTVE